MNAQQPTKGKQGAHRKPKGSKSAGKSSSKALWSSAQGWAQFDAADELLLGAEEGGFAGLEVLEDVSLIDADYLASLNEQAKQQLEAEAAAGDSKPEKKSKKQQQQQQQQQRQQQGAPGSVNKRKRAEAASVAAAADGADEDVAALKARLQQLEAENKALKKQKKQPAGDADGSAAAAVPAAAADGEPARKSRKELRAEKKKQHRLEQQQKVREQRLQAKVAKQQQRRQQEQVQLAGKQQDSDAAAEADMGAWTRFSLHPKLEAALAAQGFTSPTPIQDAVLLPAIRDRRDVIGAAQTGSGKTLAFGLPILQVLLQEQELQQLQQGPGRPADAAAGGDGEAAAGGDGEAAAGGDGEAAAGGDGEAAAGGKQQQQGSPLRALVLAPTRELALQVAEHLQALGKRVGVRVAALVGGIAPVKQERLLRSCPPVIVATPGRLWDLIRHGHKHVANLEHLSFFVLDEADRMVQQGHYQELSSILELLPTPDLASAKAAAEVAEAEELQRLEEAAAEHTQQQQQAGEDGEGPEGASEGGPEGDEQGSEDEAMLSAGDGATAEEQEAEDQGQGSEEQVAEEQQRKQQQRYHGRGKLQQQRPQKKELPRGRHHLLQTFVFSATLTLPEQLHKRLRRGGGGSSGAASLENLMDRCGGVRRFYSAGSRGVLSFRARPAIVDLSPSTQLAQRVTEGVLHTFEDERDATLYYLLARHPGRALVFVNAVSAVRRVGALLKLLGLPAVALHAQQQQRQRLKALDRFKGHPHGVLVATDVAARGLDIPNVQIVVHYQLPASADTYIHRSGRTGRTGGVDGVVLSMVTPGDASRWAALRRALEGQAAPPTFPVDDRVLAQAKQRVALAAKIDQIQRQARKAHAETTWARSNADAAGIALSDSELEDEGLADLTTAAVSAAGARGKKKKKGALAAGFEPGTEDRLESQAAAERAHAAGQLTAGLAALQRQLAAALTVPLQSSISHKFFTGGLSSAAVAAAAAARTGEVAAAAAAAAAADEEDEDGGQQLGAADGAEGGVLKPHSVLSVDAIAETMQMAARLNQSRAGQVAAAGGTGGFSEAGSKRKQQAAVRESSKVRRKAAAALVAAAVTKGDAVAKGLAGVVKKVRKQGPGKGATNAAAQQQVLMARMLMSKNEKKRQRRQGGMVVVRPGAGGVFGRDAQGASALDVLNMNR
ncbi:hypothetical protein COO60DRAFT_1699171 [Scenedesmus sp. NREL 46B-D3]|nr:hypothetical protein COO60DRAFT_1699171 [Scenedesmus sp. NREL 46B-D3]